MTFPNWSAWSYSAKTAFAALLALWISLFVGLPMPFWAMSTAYIVSSPCRAQPGPRRSIA
jgi:uncharacterized membrane protein YccC